MVIPVTKARSGKDVTGGDIIGSAQIDKEKRVITISYFEDGAFEEWLNLGRIRQLYLGGYITNLSQDAARAYLNKENSDGFAAQD